MAELTEKMRREAIIAGAVAQSRGFNIGSASPELVASCHVIARLVMPGVHRLIDTAVSSCDDRLREQVAEARMSAMRKGYQDGWSDGQAGEWAPPYTEEGP